MGRQEQLKLLLNQQNPSLIGRTLVYYEYFNNSRTSQIDSVDETLETLQSLEKDINRKTHDLQNLSVRLQGQKQELESTRNQRHSVLSALNKELKQQDKTMNSLLDDEIELQRLLKYLETVLADIPAATQGYVPFSEAKGRLAWPIQGHVRNLFGTNRSNSVANLKWQGVIIESELGQDILAIADGQVAFSDWMPRYGLLIIINHGHGYMSLYGHNQSLYKSVGEWVEQGELIAKLGDSGGQATPGLYFEIRHNSKPLNPTAWCSSKVKMSKTSYN
jgi:septal ring factor EnvC (AmiA/AmiB activator)